VSPFLLAAAPVIQWWCSAQNVPWSWTWRAYPGVWLFIVLLVIGVLRWNRAGARAAGHGTPVHPLFVAGVFTLWLALDWPLGTLGAGYLASVHMLQFLLMALIAPPLLLRGPAPEAVALLERDSRTARVLRVLTMPRNSLILFNATVLLTHVPAVVDTLMATQFGSLLIDLTWVAAGLLFWWPVVVDAPKHPRFVPPLRIGYLVLGMMFSPVMFGLVGFLVYSPTPMYSIFELAPPIPGISSHDDLQLAGVLMSLGGAIIAFIAISVIFFRWSRESA
jgi:cytochrome c oxidase assembly factor CtaG